MLLLSSCFLRVCYCTLGRLHFCGYMRGSSQLSSGSSQLSSARALLCVSTLKKKINAKMFNTICIVFLGGGCGEIV